MAPSFSNVKLIVSLAEKINMRGFSAVATQGGGGGGAAVRTTTNRIVKQKDVVKEESWIPDPVTGYYRPENHGDQVDVAQLREMLLNTKITQN